MHEKQKFEFCFHYSAAVKSENLPVFDFSNVTSLCQIKLAQECIVFAANF